MGAVAIGWLKRAWQAIRAVRRPSELRLQQTRSATYLVEALAEVSLPPEDIRRDEDLAHQLRVGVDELLARLGVWDRGEGVQVRLVRQRPRRVIFDSARGSLRG